MERELLTKDELLKRCNYCIADGECPEDCPANVDDCGPFIRKSVLKVIAEQDKKIATLDKIIDSQAENFDGLRKDYRSRIKEIDELNKQYDRRDRKADRDKAYLAGKVDALEYALVATLEKAVPKGYKF